MRRGHVVRTPRASQLPGPHPALVPSRGQPRGGGGPGGAGDAAPAARGHKAGRGV